MVLRDRKARRSRRARRVELLVAGKLVVDLLDDLLDEEDFVVIGAAGVVQCIGGQHCAALPLLGLVVAAELLEHRRARREQRRAPLEGAIGIQLGDVELLQRALGLAEVEPRAGHGDRELHADCRRQCRPIDRAAHFESAVGPAHAALAVDHEGDLIVLAGDAAVGAQLAQAQGRSRRWRRR